MEIRILQVPECIENWYDDKLYELVKSSDGSPSDKLGEAYMALGEHLADDEVGHRLFGELDEAVSAALVAYQEAAFSLGFYLAKAPGRLLLGPLADIGLDGHG